MRAWNRLGMDRMPVAFHGQARRGTHDHAYYLSEDRDHDGLIDHVTVHARSGLPGMVVAALASAGDVWLSQRATWTLVPITLGMASGELFGPSRHWISTTVYVTPTWQRSRLASEMSGAPADVQLRHELRLRRLPEPVTVRWEFIIGRDAAAVRPSAFLRTSHTRQPAPDSSHGAPSLEFAEPVHGPLAFGFGCHFGLGLLRSAARNE